MAGRGGYLFGEFRERLRHPQRHGCRMHSCGFRILPDLGQPSGHLVAVIFKVILNLRAQVTGRLEQLYEGLARCIVVPFLPIMLSLAAIADSGNNLGDRRPSDGSAC